MKNARLLPTLLRLLSRRPSARLAAMLAIPSAMLCGTPAAMAADATAPAAPAVSEQNEILSAVDTLQRLLSAYSMGNQMVVESLLEPNMIGYSRIADSMRDAEMTQRQLQVTLMDTRTHISEHVVLIQTRWDKRYVSNPGRQPMHKSGNCTFMMRPDLSGWRLSALSGDNPFTAE